jgi:hypothetical protein
MSVHKNVSGVWKETTEMHANVSGIWKEILSGWIRVSGVWKQFYKKISIPENLIAFSTSSTVTGTLKMDGSEASPNLIGKYPKAHGSEGTTGGSLTHQHNAYTGNTGSNIGHNRQPQGTREGDAITGGKQHSHTLNHTHGSQNHEPEYLKVLPVTNVSEIKTTMFLFYDGTSPPTGWSSLASAIDKLYKGDTAPETSPTGGLSTHSHAHTGNTGSTGNGKYFYP